MSIPYVTVAEFQKAVDVRALGELGSDTDADGTVNSGNVILTNSLTRASHEVRSYVLRGGMYTSDELDAIQAADDWTLKGLVCDVAVGLLISRRVGGIPEAWAQRLKNADATLRDLKGGTLIFGESGKANGARASLPEVLVVPADTRASLGLATDQPFWPRRNVQAF